MKNLLVSIVIFASFSIFTITQAAPATQQQTAEVEVLQGVVEIQRDGSSVWIIAHDNDLLAVGDSLRTDSTGEALIAWPVYGRLAQVKPNTELHIHTLRAGDDDVELDDSSSAGLVLNLDLMQGHLLVGGQVMDDPAAITIQTPAFLARVRSTTFGIEAAPDGTTYLIVTAGEVEVERDGQIVVVAAEEWLRAHADVPIADPASLEDMHEVPYFQRFESELWEVQARFNGGFVEGSQGRDEEDLIDEMLPDDELGDGDETATPDDVEPEVTDEQATESEVDAENADQADTDTDAELNQEVTPLDG